MRITGPRLQHVRLVVPILLAASVQGVSAQDTYRIVAEGMSCRQTAGAISQLRCEYRAGGDFYLVIDDVGGRLTALTFSSSNFKGDFFAQALPGGCIVVEPGAKREASTAGKAFISPKTGRVHRTVQECDAD